MAQFDHLLRNAAPVYWSDLWACWILTRYDDIVDPNDRKFDSQWQCVGGPGVRGLQSHQAGDPGQRGTWG